ncbi:MAG: hypothetical protein ABW185_23230 [Sedimenticola sp.]
MDKKKFLAKSGDPDETARYELAHLDLHHLHKPLYRYVGLKRFITC